jgi:acyl-CoA synthetase (AMP-forming)/AMP-acid ligase II
MDHTVPGLLAIRAGEDPEAVAFIVEGERPLTFGRWLADARAVAAGLAARGVAPGDRIGLVFGGADWNEYVVGYCAVHLAGGVAVPLSASRPADDLLEILVGAQARGVIHGPARPAPPGAGRWAARPDELAAGGGARPAVAGRPGDLAQILYTSGTTGRPKGVAATHANLTAGFEPRPARRPLGHSRHALHAFPIGTNAAQTMLLNALTARPAVVTMAGFDSERLCALVARHRIGSVFLVPAMAVDLLRSGALARHDLSCVRLIGSTAAALPAPVAAGLAEALPAATIVNSYTSTEAAPAQTTMLFDRRRPTAVGRPARGDIAIRGTRGEALPAGEAGAVWLRCPSIPRWYVDDPSASARVFVDGWVRMGDVGFLDDEGYLHLVDREGDVIVTGAHKVSGLRVQNALHTHPDIVDAAVVGVEHPSMGAVVGAVVVARAAVELGELRAFLAGGLARHELPARLAVVAALPRNEAGKVVPRELAALLRPAPRDGAAPPRTDAQRRLARIWRGVLGGAAVDAAADFFQCGGDSMRAAQVAALAADEWRVGVSAEDVFARPTLEAFAAWIERRPAGSPAPAPDDPPGARLTAVQRMWLAEGTDRDSLRVVPVYVAIAVDEPLDAGLVRRALEALTERHEELRTLVAETPQRLRPAEAVHVEHRTAGDLEHATALAAGFVTAAARPPVRALVVTVAPDRHLLTLSIDHLVCDGWSMGIVLRDFGLLYSALRTGSAMSWPPAERVTAADVARWAHGQWPRTRDYWQEVLARPVADPQPLPGQATRPARYDGASHEFTIDAGVAGALRATALARRSTLARVTLAAWAATLRRHTGSAELAFLTPLTGRTRPEWEWVVGCLMQQPVIRVRLDDDPPPLRLLDRVHREAGRAAEHQFYPAHEFAGRVRHPAYFFFEPWNRPAHVPGLRSAPVALPPELGLRRPLDGPDLSPPRLRLTDRDDVVEAQIVFNREAVPRAAIEELAGGLLQTCRSLALSVPTPD